MTTIPHDSKNDIDNVVLIDLVDDDIDTDEHDSINAKSVLSYSSELVPQVQQRQHNEESLKLFQSIMPQYSTNEANRILHTVNWNVEDAINHAISTATINSTSHRDIKSKQQTLTVDKKRKRDIKTEENDENINQQNKSLIKDVVISKDEFYKFSHQWKTCIEQTKQTNIDHYIDMDFPPSSQSLDGRCRTINKDNYTRNTNNNYHTISSSTTSESDGGVGIGIGIVTKCYCNVPATPKQVQTDGPNYGRFYLCCGIKIIQQQQKLKQQQQKKQLKEKTHVTNNCDSNLEQCTKKEATPTKNKQTTDQSMIVIKNPYMRKNHSSTTNTNIIIQNNTTSTSPNSDKTEQSSKILQQGPCKFFQWDTTGILGTMNYKNQNNNNNNDNNHDSNNNNNNSDDGYNLIRRNDTKISWFRFGIEQQCVLYHNNISNNSHKKFDISHIRQGAIGNCWFLSALTVVVEKNYIIEHIIQHTTLNSIGCYQINLFIDGQWEPIIIDSYLPVVYKPLGSDNIISTNGSKTKKAKVPDTRNGIPVQIKKQQNDSEIDVSATEPQQSSKCCTSYIALPAFCATPQRQIWPALIEKAYAKVHGSYQQLSGGYIAEGLQDLTGAPCETFIFDTIYDIEMFWTQLLSFHTTGFVMGVATYSGGDGLVGGHAYSILDVLDVPDVVIGEQSKVTDYFTKSSTDTKAVSSMPNDCPNKGADSKDDGLSMVQQEQQKLQAVRYDRTNVRLVRIRNPWGKREWNGDWSVSSERWTRTLRKRLGHTTSYAKNDGTFYMSFEDMIQRFHHLDVAKTQKGWVNTSIDGIFVSNSDPILSSKSIYRLSVNKTTQAYISIIQPKKRSNTKTQYWYCDPSMILMRKKCNSDDTWEHVACSLNGTTRQCHLEIFIEVGYTYYSIPWSCALSSDRPFRLVTYSGTPISVEALHPCPESDTDDSNQTLAMLRPNAVRTLLSELLKCNDGQVVYPIKGTLGQNGLLMGMSGENHSVVYIVAVNGSNDHYLSLRITPDNVDNGQFVCTVFNRHGKAIPTQHHDLDIPPLSQKFLLVVTSTGTQKRNDLHIKNKHPSFRYVTSWVASNVPTGISKSLSSFDGFGCSMKLCPAGWNALQVHCVNSTNTVETVGCSGVIETLFENANPLLGSISR